MAHLTFSLVSFFAVIAPTKPQVLKSILHEQHLRLRRQGDKSDKAPAFRSSQKDSKQTLVAEDSSYWERITVDFQIGSFESTNVPTIAPLKLEPTTVPTRTVPITNHPTISPGEATLPSLDPTFISTMTPTSHDSSPEGMLNFGNVRNVYVNFCSGATDDLFDMNLPDIPQDSNLEQYVSVDGPDVYIDFCRSKRLSE